MENSKKTLEFKFERTIPAPPVEVFDGWLESRRFRQSMEYG